MVREPASQGRERATVKRGLSPCTTLPVDVRLRSWVAGDYWGFDEASLPHDCAGGSGDGPRFMGGSISVDQSSGDPYDLDRDSDGVGCES